MACLARLFAGLLRNRSGNILPLAAMAIFAVAALIGGAVDISRAWRTHTRLQAACDAGVLAGRRAVTNKGYDKKADDEAKSYFAANFVEEIYGSRDTTFSASSADKGETIDGIATTRLPPLLMQLFGYGAMDIVTRCTASMQIGNSDVMMVLDTTGSMDWILQGNQTRIQALRASMKSFYDTVETAVSGTNARVRYGFVPYSSSVNVGHLLINLNPDYVVDSWTIQSRIPIYRNQTVTTGYQAPTAGAPTTTTSPVTWSGWTNHSGTSFGTLAMCNSTLPADTAWTNSGPATTTTTTTINGAGQQVTTTTTTQPQTMIDYQCNGLLLLFNQQRRTGSRNLITTVVSTANPIQTTIQVFDRWEYRPVTYNTSRYKLFEDVTTNTGDNGAAVTSRWQGCIEERQTEKADAYSWSSISGFTPSGALDLDIDRAPDGSQATKWAPMWPEVAYIRTYVWNGTTYMDPNTPTASGQRAASFCPSRARLLAPMSKADFYAYADALKPEGATYHDIGLVWGGRMISPDGMWRDNVREVPSNRGEVSRHLIFMTDGEMAPNFSIQSSWGIEYHDRRVTNDGVTNQTARHNSRFLAICEAVKAKGIRLWVIAFAQAMTQPLATCASSNSAFTASNASQLEAAFQSIAKQVGQLRVVQ
ncbi:MAG: pilus assembly protein TadG-related protein [Novosphingobium sp.]